MKDGKNKKLIFFWYQNLSRYDTMMYLSLQGIDSILMDTFRFYFIYKDNKEIYV